MEAPDFAINIFHEHFEPNTHTLKMIHDIEDLYRLDWIHTNHEEDELVMKILSTLHDIMNIDFTIVERRFVTRKVNQGKKTVSVEKIEQSENSYCLFDLMNEISSKHVHSTDKATCEFHPESLLTHSYLTMFISMIRAIKNKLSERDILEISFLGLFHDVGKYMCCTESNINGKVVTTFPFHGEMGCGILLQMFNSEFSKYFSKETWENICRTICVHMNYHLSSQKNSFQVSYDMKLLSLENTEVKKYLMYLTVGDFLGAMGHKTEDIMKCLKIFEEKINEKFDMTNFMSTYMLNGLVILIRGMSAFGKTTFIERIVKMFSDTGIKYRVVNRDNIISRIVSSSLGETTMTQPESYYHRIFQEDKSTYSRQVNSEMKNTISSGLSNHEVVIIDTLMNYFDSIEAITPSNMRDAFIMSIDVVRNTLITEKDCERHSMTMDKQMELSGSKSVFCWLAKECSMRIRHISSLSSSSSMIVDYVRPRLCHVVSWNDEIMVGYEEFLRQLQVLVNYDFSHVSKVLETLDVLTYANRMYQSDGWSGMVSAFKSYGFITTVPTCGKNPEFENKIIRIKYRDNSDKWAPMWARQCRGIVLMLDNDKVICVKYQMPRGAESLTTLHIEKSITETQDCTTSSLAKFDSGQQLVMSKLMDSHDLPIDGALTFKCDGSLMGCTVYFGSYAKLVESMITKYGDSYSHIVLKLGQSLGMTCVLSTQGTFSVGNEMQNYMTTSILSTCFTHDEIVRLAETSTCVELMEKYGLPFFEKIKKFIENYTIVDGCVTLNFETVCRHRLTAWNEFHKELAISYPETFYRYLGLSISGSETKFIPHFRTINSVFDEPMWWKIEHTKQINEMILDLSKCIHGVMTEDEFLVHHPYSNKTSPNTKFFDYEGFVFYSMNSSPYFEYDYNKIKTLEYYMTHKFRTDNIAYLLELSKTAHDIFPMTRLVSDFFTTIKTKLQRVSEDVFAILNEPTNELFDGLPDKAKAVYVSKPKDMQIKMLLNASNNRFSVIHKSFISVFPELATITDEETLNDLKQNCRYIIDMIIIQNKSIEFLVTEKDDHILKLLEILMSTLPTESSTEI